MLHLIRGCWLIWLQVLNLVLVDVDDMLAALPDAIYHLESFDALLVRSSLLHYLAAEYAAQFVPLVLVGEGADALFAGLSQYKKIPLPEMTAVLLASTRRMHNEGLQRADRCGSAHGLTTAVPFLNHRLATFALCIPPELKIVDGQEKWCLLCPFRQKPVNNHYADFANDDKPMANIRRNRYIWKFSNCLRPHPSMADLLSI